MKFVLIIFVFFICNQSYSNTALREAALCGSKISDVRKSKERLKKRKILEKKMPPVKSQSPSSWCFAFTISDMLTYYNFIHSGSKNSKEFYSKKNNIISPIDVVHAEDNYTSVGRKSHRVNLNEGGLSFQALLGIQELNYKIRSTRQVPFYSFEEMNSSTNKRARSLINLYKKTNPIIVGQYYTKFAGLSCPLKYYNSSEFQDEISSFKGINSYLFNLASKNDSLINNYEIDEYNKILENDDENFDINLRPFMSSEISVDDETRYLFKIGNIINPKNKKTAMPVKVSICKESLDAKLSAPGEVAASCGLHEVNIVGAYYQNGKCMVRLRNSYGSDWGDNGHISLTVDEFINSQKKNSSDNNNKNTFSAVWISKSNSKITKKESEIISDSNTFRGHYEAEYISKDKLIHHYKKGVQYNLSGDIEKVYNFNINKKGFYTGTVSESNDGLGALKALSGKYKNEAGKTVYITEYEFSDGLIFTGPVTEDDNGLLNYYPDQNLSKTKKKAPNK